MEIAHGQGATPERRNHGYIIRDVRSGRLGQFGHTEKNPLLLDKLASEGFLGAGRDLQERYDSGYKLRELWFGFNISASQQTLEPKSMEGYGYLTDNITNTDISEERYHAVMRALPVKYHKTIKAICIDEIIHEVCWITPSMTVQCNRDKITDALDALYGAFKRVKSLKGDT